MSKASTSEIDPETIHKGWPSIKSVPRNTLSMTESSNPSTTETNAQIANDTQHLTVVDSVGFNRDLHIYVRDDRDAETFKIDFRANTMGEFKPDGGGHPAAQADRYEAAKEVARTFLTDVLGHSLLPADEWDYCSVNAAKTVLEDSDKYTVSRVDSNE